MKRLPRPLRLAARAVVSLAAGSVLLELALRAALFSPLFGSLLGGAADALRRPELYANTRTDDEYWKLKYLFTPERERRPNPAPDPLLGWRLRAFGPPPDYVAPSEDLVSPHQRPLLFYGDSFTQCLTPPEECWSGLVALSPWARALGVVNYGVSGYGLDQIHLLLEATLPRWTEREPVVVIGIFVGDDLNRSALRLRTWPKPFFELAGDGLTLVPPLGATGSDFLAEHPPAIRSYLWRWLLYGSGWVDARTAARLSGRGEHLDEVRSRCRRLLRAIHEQLEREGTRGFFLLMPGIPELRTPEPRDWQEPFLIGELDRLGAAWVSTRDDFEAELRDTGNPLSHYFAKGHYNAAGNAVAFRAVDRGLRALVSGTADGGTDDGDESTR